MSILINGMKKPTACYRCQLRTGKYCGILTENEKCADDGVLPHCPIVEIPEPHGRLIDADEVIKDQGDWYVEEITPEPTDGFVGSVEMLLNEMPVVIPEEK